MCFSIYVYDSIGIILFYIFILYYYHTTISVYLPNIKPILYEKLYYCFIIILYHSTFLYIYKNSVESQHFLA